MFCIHNIHACIHAYIHSCIHAICIHAICLHAICIHAICIHAYIHSYIHTTIHPYNHTTIHTYTHTYIYIYIYIYIRIQYLNPGYVTKPSFSSSQVDDHHAEKSFIFDARKDTPLVDVAGQMRGKPMENHGTLRKQWENQPKTLKFDS